MTSRVRSYPWMARFVRRPSTPRTSSASPSIKQECSIIYAVRIRTRRGRLSSRREWRNETVKIIECRTRDHISHHKYNSPKDEKNVMASGGILRSEFEWQDHHRYSFSLPRDRTCAGRSCRSRTISATTIEIQPRLLVPTHIAKRKNDHVWQNQTRCARGRCEHWFTGRRPRTTSRLSLPRLNTSPTRRSIVSRRRYRPTPSVRSVIGRARPALLCRFSVGKLRFGTDAADHRFQSVRSLRGEVLAQPKPVEQAERIDAQNVPCRHHGEPP
jgi:hypothetical protein